jgi:Predicted acyltransferases
MSVISYRPEIDGLRALAVIPVVLFHFGFDWINGGYIGVDVFFVISGYLITAILLKENSNQTFSFANFWLRRIRRILPALLVMVTGTLAISYFLVFGPTLQSYASDALSAVFSYANFAMLFKFGDYWGPAAEASPFLHAWSLSVEEQFYLFYPVLIYLLYKKDIRQKINPTYALIGIIVLSLALFLYASDRYPLYGFYLLPTRAWELACGGVLAMATPSSGLTISTRLVKVMPSLGLLLILISYFSAAGTEGIGLVAVLAVLGSMMIIGWASPREPVGQILGHRIAVFIGKISYSLYLWHWPLIVLGKQISYKPGVDHVYLIVTITVLMVSISVLSYFLVETPTRRMKSVLPLIAVLFIGCISVILIYKTPVVNKFYDTVFEKTEFYGAYYDISPVIPEASKATGKMKRRGIIAPDRDSVFQDTYDKEGIVTSRLEGYPAIVVLGDSHGSMWSKLIDEIGDEMAVKESFYTSVGNNLIFSVSTPRNRVKRQGFNHEQWIRYVESVKKNLDLWKPKLLIIASKWSIRSQQDFENLEEIVQFVSKNGTHVLFLNQPPIISAFGDNNAAQVLSYLGYKPSVGYQTIKLSNDSMVQAQNNKLNELVNKFPGTASVFDVNSYYTRDGGALVINDNAALYYDDDHLSYQGTQVVKDDIKNVIAFHTNRQALLPHSSQANPQRP